MKHTDVPAQQGWSRRRWLKRTAVGAAAGAAALASGVSLSSQAGRGRSDPGNSGRGGSDQGGRGAAPEPAARPAKDVLRDPRVLRRRQTAAGDGGGRRV